MEIGLNVPTTSAQPGFLSIDCGNTQGNYTDSAGLQWVTDSGQYMNIGETIEQPSVNEIEASRSFRYFPENRTKYCYELPTPHAFYPYLIRASFYMNESLLNKIQFSGVQFTLSLDATDWFIVSNIVGESQGFLSVVEEAIFYPPNQVTNVCLQSVVGSPFISSLELRFLEKLHAYADEPNNNKQYFALAFRYNLGAQSTAPNVRYPDDIFDRIWTTPDKSWNTLCPNVSIPEAPDTNISQGSNYVPPKVMKDAWLFNSTGGCADVNFPVYVNGSVYMTPAAYFLASVYIEHLNKSDSKKYADLVSANEFSHGENLAGRSKGSFAQTANLHTFTYLDLSENYVQLTPKLLVNASLNDGPTLNAVEVYGQYNYNFSTTNSDDVVAITVLQNGFSLKNWQGDPCTPVPHDWLSCEASLPIFGNINQPCRDRKLSSVSECRAPQADLRTKYSATSINISNRTIRGFSGVIGNTSAFPTLAFLKMNNMSITNSGVDSATFQFLMKSTSGSVNMSNLDLSYNAIEYIPPASDWAALENLISVNLAHNNLTGELSPVEDVLFFNKLQNLNLSYNAMTSFRTMWTNTTRSLVVLDLSYNQLQEDISTLDKWLQINNESLQELNVSNNNLGGIFSSYLYFQGLPKLRVAHFDQNSIEGILNLSAWFTALQAANNAYSTNSSIPDVTLQLFSFISNNISEIVPTAESLDSTIRSLMTNTQGSFSNFGILLGGNPYCRSFSSAMHEYLCRPSTDVLLKAPYPEMHNNRRLILIIAICGGLGGVLFFIVLSTTLWSLWKQVYALREVQKELTDRKVQPPFYRYSDLKLATRNFSKDNKLGQGAFGIVYKGDLADETPIGVKKLFNQERLQVLDEFLNEVVLITGIKHRNLIQLKGCCIEKKQRILVYEYAEKGNLAEALWGLWVLDLGAAFEDLCGSCSWAFLPPRRATTVYLHRDIKPENILLDTNLSPKIADFGLARYVSDDPNYARSTKVAGTIGYFAPEYIMHGELSDKIDVYSYGVLILEIVSGRKCIDPSRPTEEKFLTNWVASMKENDLLFDVLQRELREHCVMAEVIRAIHIGLLCVQHLPERRPTMSQVVTMFLGNLDIRVVPDKSDDMNYKNFNNLLATIDSGTEYPTLEVVEEDSSVFPLLVLESLSSFNYTNSGSGSRPQTELSPIYGR